jgi:hypothetical protein
VACAFRNVANGFSRAFVSVYGHNSNTLILCKANIEHLRYMCALFLFYEAVFGLKINHTGSELVYVGNVNNVDGLASILGCVVSLPSKYFGLPWGSPFKAKSIWDGVIEKIEHRLAGQKRMYLSKDGRITLTKSTLFNLPTYFMSHFPLPPGLANCIENLQ